MNTPSILNFIKNKKEKKPLSMVTCYDYWSAQIIRETPIDSILVGDSVSMVVHGHPTTVHATTEMMALHTAAVARGNQGKKLIVSDLPFLTYRSNIHHAMQACDQLMKAGAHALKLEGVWGHEDIIQKIIGSGIPVMGHIGLTPQSIYGLGGFKVQGKDEKSAHDLLEQAKKLEALGCFSIVLECIPTDLGKEITQHISIPTIGIGAGPYTDGQVLVLQDLLGLNSDFKPKFLRKFLEGKTLLESALKNYHDSVVQKQFPTEEESYL